MMRVPATIPFSIDWLPDGQLLVVAGPGAAGANDRIWSFMIFSFVLLIYVSVHTMTRTAFPERACPEHHWRVPRLPPHTTMRPLLIFPAGIL
jgi:hypothetical protein